MIDHAMAPIRHRLLACLPGDGSAAVRCVFSFGTDGGEGHVLNVVIDPARFGDCMTPLVTGLRMPATRVFREARVYTIAEATAAASGDVSRVRPAPAAHSNEFVGLRCAHPRGRRSAGSSASIRAAFPIFKRPAG